MFIPLNSMTLGILMINPASCTVVIPHYQQNHLSGEIEELSLITFTNRDAQILVKESFSSLCTLFKEQVPAFIQLTTIDNNLALVNFSLMSLGITSYQRNSRTDVIHEHTQLVMAYQNHFLYIKQDLNSLNLYLQQQRIPCSIALLHSQELCLLGFSLATQLSINHTVSAVGNDSIPKNLLHFTDVSLKAPLVSASPSLIENTWLKLRGTSLVQPKSYQDDVLLWVNPQLITFIEPLAPLLGTGGALLHFIGVQHTQAVVNNISYFTSLLSLEHNFLRLHHILHTDILVNLDLVSVVQQGYNTYGSPNPYLSLFFVDGKHPTPIKESWSHIKAFFSHKDKVFISLHLLDGLEILINPCMVSHCFTTHHSSPETTEIYLLQMNDHITVQESIFLVMNALWSAKE